MSNKEFAVAATASAQQQKQPPIRDDVFAMLMDMFGDALSSDIILNVGTLRLWDRKCNNKCTTKYKM